MFRFRNKSLKVGPACPVHFSLVVVECQKCDRLAVECQKKRTEYLAATESLRVLGKDATPEQNTSLQARAQQAELDLSLAENELLEHQDTHELPN